MGTNEVYCSNKVAAGQSDSYSYKCLSGVSLGGFCCAEGVTSEGCASGMCDSGTGACSTKSSPGQSCTTTDDCFGGNACLGSEGNKRCCAFTESNFNANNGMYKGCNSCGDETAQDIYDMVNLASVRRVNLGTLTSTDKHIQPSRFSRATMSFWGVA